MNNISRVLILVFNGVLMVFSLNAQTAKMQISKSGNDTLTLKQIMAAVIENHPVIKKAKESLNDADAQIGLAKSGYYPSIDATVNVSNVGPVPSLSIPDFGSFDFFPRNNFDASVNVHENVYDFGRTSSNIALAKGKKELLKTSLATTKQGLAKSVIQNYFTLLYLQEAVKIKDEQLSVLQSHLDFVNKRKATGSGTDYDILSTKVKISGVENQKLDITAAQQVQLSKLNSLLGLPAKTFHTVKDTLINPQAEMTGDSAIPYALQHREEMKIAQKKTDLATMHLDVVKRQNRPTVGFLAKGGVKNGYVPEIKKIKPDYVLGLGLEVPIYDGTRYKYSIGQAESTIKISSCETKITKRNISSEVVENESKLETAAKKLEQTELLLSQAQEAFKLAQTNYSAGAITNLDLLDATTSVSESKLMVLKAQIDLTVSAYMLEAAVGNRLY